MKKIFLERKTNLGHKCILNHFNQILSTNCKKKWFLIIKSPRSSKNYFCYKSSFSKRSFIAKKLDMELIDIFGFFFKGCLSSFLKGLFIFFHLKNKNKNGLHCMFFQCSYTISCVIYD